MKPAEKLFLNAAGVGSLVGVRLTSETGTMTDHMIHVRFPATRKCFSWPARSRIGDRATNIAEIVLYLVGGSPVEEER